MSVPTGSYRDEVNVLRPVLAGVVTALVGFGGAFPVVLAGLRAVGADERQAASGLLAVCLASGIVAVVLGLRTRMPVSLAQSPSCESTPQRSKAKAHGRSDGRRPGPQLLIAAGPQPGGFAVACGAFLLCGALIVFSGLVRALGRLIGAIPPPIARAMLAGVLLPLCLAPVKAVAEVPLLAVPVGPAARAGDRLALSNRLDEPGPMHGPRAQHRCSITPQQQQRAFGWRCAPQVSWSTFRRRAGRGRLLPPFRPPARPRR